MRRALLVGVAAPAIAIAVPAVLAAQPRAEAPTLVGAALRERPEWDGSATRRTDIIPVLRHYGPRWFARTTQGVLEGGYRERLAPDFYAGAQLAYEPAHRDFGAGASAGLHLEWDERIGPAPLNFVLRVRQHLDTDRGAQTDLRATLGVLDRWGLRAGIYGQATWGSRNAQRARYGAERSGLTFAAVGLLAAYDLGARWMLVGSVERRALYDDAAESPFTERVSNYYASAGLAYRWPAR